MFRCLTIEKNTNGKYSVIDHDSQKSVFSGTKKECNNYKVLHDRDFPLVDGEKFNPIIIPNLKGK